MATATGPKRKRRRNSILKRIRQTARRTAINRANKSHLRTHIKSFRRALAAGNLSRARELLTPTLALIDHSVHRGVLHANTAARTRSRLVLRYNALAQPPSTQPAAR